MKWRFQMCGTIVEADQEPYDCTGCKFKNRYMKYEEGATLTNKRGQTKRFRPIHIDENQTIREEQKPRYIDIVIENRI